MDNNKDAIIRATMALIIEKGEQLNEITVREISKKAGVGLGLINYHFGNKDKLIEICVDKMIRDTEDRFRPIRDNISELPPFEKLEFLGNTTLAFLFGHYSIAKNYILSDLHSPKETDSTQRAYLSYLPIVAACRPDWDKKTVMRKTFTLISTIQQMLLRHQEILSTQGVDLTAAETRKEYHLQILHDILEM